MKRRKKPVFIRQCDWCGTDLQTNEPNSDSYVMTVDHKIFCKIHTPGKEPFKDCLEDYAEDRRKNNVRKKEEKEKRFKQVQETKKSQKVLDGFDQYLAELKQKSRRLRNEKT